MSLATRLKLAIEGPGCPAATPSASQSRLLGRAPGPVKSHTLEPKYRCLFGAQKVRYSKWLVDKNGLVKVGEFCPGEDWDAVPMVDV